MNNTVSQKPTTNRFNPDSPQKDSTVNSPQVLRLRRAADTGTAPSIFAIGEFERYVAVVASRLTTSSPERLDSELQGVVATLGRIVSDGSISLHLFNDEQDTVQTTYHFSHSNGSMVWHVPRAIAEFAWSLRDLRWFEKDHMPRAGGVPLALAGERSRALAVSGANSVVNIPLWAGPRQHGALVLTSNSSTRRLSEGDVTLLKILGQVLANGLAHVHMERELGEREHRFRAIANYAFDWEDWLDPRGKLLYVNPAVERITGYTVSECHAMPEYPLPIVHEQDRPVVAERLKGALAGSSGNDLEFRIRTRDNRDRWVAVSWQPIYDEAGEYLGTRSSMRNITKRKVAERQMKAANDALRNLINSAPESAALVDRDGCFVAINETLGNLIGKPRDQIIGRSILKLLPKSIAQDRFKKGLKVLETGKPLRYDGSLAGRSMDVHFKPIFDENGNVRQIAVFARDVTEEQRINRELKEIQVNLKARVRERTRELADTNRTLMEERHLLQAKNAALQEIFKQIEQSKTELSARIKKNIHRAALPVLERIRHHTNETGNRHLSLLTDILADIASPLVDGLDAATERLTPREMEICTMVRNGFSCKQIAESLGVALQTILKQRARIRRKLGLTNQKVNLASYLTSLERKRLGQKPDRRNPHTRM